MPRPLRASTAPVFINIYYYRLALPQNHSFLAPRRAITPAIAQYQQDRWPALLTDALALAYEYVEKGARAAVLLRAPRIMLRWCASS